VVMPAQPDRAGPVQEINERPMSVGTNMGRTA
jgi:hypothetical protein